MSFIFCRQTIFSLLGEKEKCSKQKVMTLAFLSDCFFTLSLSSPSHLSSLFLISLNRRHSQSSPSLTLLYSPSNPPDSFPEQSQSHEDTQNDSHLDFIRRWRRTLPFNRGRSRQIPTSSSRWETRSALDWASQPRPRITWIQVSFSSLLSLSPFPFLSKGTDSNDTNRTRNGVHTSGDRVTAPSEMRLKALDLLLEKLSVNTRQAQLIPRIVAISGSGQVSLLSPFPSVAASLLIHLLVFQPGVLHFLNPQFESLLAILDNSSSRRISEIINSSTAFTLEEPASSGDSSSMTQVRKLETHFGKLSLSSSSSTTSSSSSPSTSALTVSSASSYILTNQQHLQTLEKGREFFASKTGSRVLPQYSAAQLLKIREKDDESLENGEIPSREGGVLGRTGRIVTESSLLSSIFSGKWVPLLSLSLSCSSFAKYWLLRWACRLVPIEASDAGSTNLFNPVEEDWEDKILGFVMRGTTAGKFERSGEDLRGGARLRKLLGEVQKDGTKSVSFDSLLLAHQISTDSLRLK